MNTVPPPSSPEKLDLEWRNPPGMIGLSFKIFFLRIITLGIYHFWGKAEVRRRIWSAIRLNDEPLEYTGTGKELFLGFLVVFFLLLLPFFAVIVGLQFWLGPQNPVAGLVIMVAYPLFFYLFGVAIYRARRYRLTRTRWRGIRGGMAGSPWAFGWTFVWTTILLVFSIGIAWPWWRVKLNRILIGDTMFGSERFHFEGGAGPLFKKYLLAWLGGIALYVALGGLVLSLFWGSMKTGTPAQPSVAAMIMVFMAFIGFFIAMTLIMAWYRASEYNYFAACTRIDTIRFHLNATAGSLIGLVLMNVLILIISLGIAFPVIQMRMVRYFVARLQLEGRLDVVRIAQSTSPMDRTGEGLAEVFDIDAF